MAGEHVLVVGWLECILLGVQIRDLYGLGLREMEYFLIWRAWIRQGLVSI